MRTQQPCWVNPYWVPSNLVPYVTQTAIGKRAKLTVFGNDYDTVDGSNIRDFIHVVDVANAHVKSFEYLQRQPAGNYYEAFNLGTGDGVSVLQLVNKFQNVTGVKLNFEINGSAGPAMCESLCRPNQNNDQNGLETKLFAWRWFKKKHAWAWEKKLQVIWYSIYKVGWRSLSLESKYFDLMLHHYWLTALRNLKRYKLFTFINVIGLSVGIAIFSHSQPTWNIISVSINSTNEAKASIA